MTHDAVAKGSLIDALRHLEVLVRGLADKLGRQVRSIEAAQLVEAQRLEMERAARMRIVPPPAEAAT